MIVGATVRGVEGHIVRVMRLRADGLPRFKIIGLSTASEREARVRVQAALHNAGVALELCTEVICDAGVGASLDGVALDLPIALAIATEPDDVAVGAIGELSLAGDVRPVRGVLSAVEALRKVVKVVLVAPENAAEAALVGGVDVYAVRTLVDALSIVSGTPRPDLAVARSRTTLDAAAGERRNTSPDMRDVRGQRAGRRALEIAAAGQHHVLFVGNPGAGKTMLARRLSGLLPTMTPNEALEVTRVHSAAGLNIGGGLAMSRPFRAPHHSTTPPGLVGGGASAARPGELSLAHHGVLFLDELNEFSRPSLEVLREPVATGEVVLCRASGTIRFPASALLVASLLPCPCGHRGTPRCRCAAADVARYFGRVPRALLDVFDLRVQIPALDVAAMADEAPSETTASVFGRVTAARAHAAAREATHAAPATTRLARVARTIADLALSTDVLPEHFAEAEALVELTIL